MDQGQAYAIAIGVVAVALALSAWIRRRKLRHHTFALIRQDLAEVRTHTHLHQAPSGELSPSTPDGPKPTEPARTLPPTGRVRCVVGPTASATTVSLTTSKAA